ncbi:MAG TPA: ATP-binding protein [Myxococcota bacterium]|nr:ATP-binding protein [Myxococcota bacterium]
MGGLALFLLGAFVGAIPPFLLSRRLLQAVRTRRRREHALRAAVQARIWEDEVAKVSPLGGDSPQLAQRRHEANNALSTALLSAQFLSALACASDSERAQAGAEQKLAATELVEALLRLKGMLADAGASQTTTPPRAPGVVAVPLCELVTARAARVRARHPQVAIEVVLARPSLEQVRVRICAGAEGLASVLDALFANACEGDGVRGAQRLRLRIGTEGEIGAVSLELEDDGPGFTAAQLAEPPRPLGSTKPGRLGLGLYTVQHVLAASGGSLRRENLSEGGARVTAFLPAVSSDSLGAPGQ